MDAKSTDLVIIDEADYFLFNETETMTALSEKNNILVFTATITKSDFETVEIGVVDLLGFEAMDYSVVNLGVQDEPNFHENIADTDGDKLVDLV